MTKIRRFLQSKTINLFNKGSIVQQYYIHATTGALAYNKDYAATDYINVEGLTHITETYFESFAFPFGGGAGYAFYDANKQRISGGDHMAQQSVRYITYEVPEGAVYFRESLQNSTTYGYTAKTLIIVEGTTVPTEWVPPFVNRILKETTPGFRLVQDYAGTGLINLGNINWQKSDYSGLTIFKTQFTDAIDVSPATISPIYTDAPYKVTSFQGRVNKSIFLCKNFYWAVNGLYICDNSYADKTAEEFKASVNGYFMRYQRSSDPAWGPIATASQSTIPRIITEEVE